MNEWELEVPCSTDDPDVSASIDRHRCGSEVTASDKTRIDERGPSGIEFSQAPADGELRKRADTRIGRHGICMTRARASDDGLSRTVHGNGYALKAVTDKRRVNKAGAIRSHLGDERCFGRRRCDRFPEGSTATAAPPSGPALPPCGSASPTSAL